MFTIDFDGATILDSESYDDAYACLLAEFPITRATVVNALGLAEKTGRIEIRNSSNTRPVTITYEAPR